MKDLVPRQVGIFHSKRGRGELGEVWREKVAGREGVEERMLQTGIIRFLNMVKIDEMGKGFNFNFPKIVNSIPR